MRQFRKHVIALVIALLTLGGATVFTSCGTMHSYWGIENEYEFPDGGHHHHHKHKKHKKHHKHHRHHHHDDD